MAEPPVVIVTGASRGMGRDIARWLAVAGAKVVVSARTESALEDVAQWVRARGSQALPIGLDVSEHRQCKAAVDKTVAVFGRIDAVVNNAGVLGPVAAMADADPEKWRNTISVNLLGPFYLTHEVLPHLRKTRGKVVNISTGAAWKVIEGWSAYCAAKAGAAHMTRVLAAEESEITVVSFRPGLVDTDMQAEIRRQGAGAMTRERREYFQKLKDEKQLLPPTVPAREAAWLALHAPASWSGQMIETGDPRIEESAKKTLPDAID